VLWGWGTAVAMGEAIGRRALARQAEGIVGLRLEVGDNRCRALASSPFVVQRVVFHLKKFEVSLIME
jgi:hypothetical protein